MENGTTLCCWCRASITTHALQGRTWGDYLNIQDQIRYPKVPSGGDATNGDCLAPTSGQGLVMRPVNGKFGGRLVFCATQNAYQGDVPVYSDDGGKEQPLPILPSTAASLPPRHAHTHLWQVFQEEGREPLETGERVSNLTASANGKTLGKTYSFSKDLHYLKSGLLASARAVPSILEHAALSPPPHTRTRTPPPLPALPLTGDSTEQGRWFQ